MSEFKFSCPQCGQHISATPCWIGHNVRCPACQHPFLVPAPAELCITAVSIASAEAVGSSTGSAVRSAAPSQPARYSAVAGRPAIQPSVKTSGLAIASLICGILPFGALPAVVCGHLAMSQIKKDRSVKGKGLAFAGLVLGYIGITFTLAAATSFFLAGRAMRDGQFQTSSIQETQQGLGKSGSAQFNVSSGSGTSLTLIVMTNQFIRQKDAYALKTEHEGLGGSYSFGYTGFDVIEFQLDSEVLKGSGTFRTTAPRQVKIIFSANSTKPFSFAVRGLTKPEVKVDGKAADGTKPIPAGKRTIVVNGSILVGAAAPARGGAVPGSPHPAPIRAIFGSGLWCRHRINQWPPG